jgi:hypothetical protein
MNSYLIYDNEYNRKAIIGTHKFILDYIMNPENEVCEFYKTQLIGEGDICIYAISDNLNEDAIYLFKNEKEALEVLQKRQTQNNGFEKIVCILLNEEDLQQ